MSNKYYFQFTKMQFLSTMNKISITYNLRHIKDVTKEVEELSNTTINEYVYSLPTKNKSVDILIYSSLDRSTNQVRDNGSDAVRLVMRWKTKNGYVYKSLGKHLRIKTLFVNIRKSLVRYTEGVFDLNYSEFTPYE